MSYLPPGPLVYRVPLKDGQRVVGDGAGLELDEAEELDEEDEVTALSDGVVDTPLLEKDELVLAVDVVVVTTGLTLTPVSESGDNG